MTSSVLLIGGFASTPRTWDPLIQWLSSQHHYITPNPYWYQNQAASSIEQMVANIEKQLPKRPIEHIIAHSMGCLIALHLLQQISERPKTITLLAPVSIDPAKAIPEEVAELLDKPVRHLIFSLTRGSFTSAFIRQNGALLRTLFRQDHTLNQACIQGQLHALRNMTAVPLPSGDWPKVLALIAEQDKVVPAQHSRETAARLAQRTITLPDVSCHGFPIELPETVAHHWQDFIQSVE